MNSMVNTNKTNTTPNLAVQLEGKKLDDEESDHKKRKYWRVDCQSASKGTAAMVFTRAHLFLRYLQI